MKTNVKHQEKKINERSNPGIIFLGTCERASYVEDGNTNIFKWNILGLKHVILSHIYPLPLNGLILGIAVDKNIIRNDTKIDINHQDGQKVGFVNIRIEQTKNSLTEDISLKKKGQMLSLPKKGWSTVFFSIKKNDLIISKPGSYYLTVETDEQKETIGEIQFAVIDPPPLTPERVAAIKSDPTSAKFIRLELSCKKCSDVFKTYAALEPPNQKLEDEGHYLYTSIPDQFTCGCGSTNINLQIIRKNLHGLLGSRVREGLGVAFSPLYEKSILTDIKNKFVKLINSKPKEEILQKFIEENLILLHQFPAEEILFKPPILTFFKADFGIITHQKELILIEIEKSTTELLKKDGGQHSALNHAFDQIGDWLHKVDEHRLACLDSMKIDSNKVSRVRGVVIAGRDSGYDAQHLRKLKGADRGRVSFLTYDDMLFALDSLIRKIEKL